MKSLTMPLLYEEINSLKVGEKVLLSGKIYTARDAAHKRLLEVIEKNLFSPIDFENQGIYYVGPCPNKEGEIIGSAGPTTSIRMDFATPKILDEFKVKVLIGKGERGREVIEAIKRNKAIYFAAIGGCGALISKCIKKAKVVAYEDLLSEAIYELEVCDLPLIVAIDSMGNNIYQIERKKYKKK